MKCRQVTGIQQLLNKNNFFVYTDDIRPQLLPYSISKKSKPNNDRFLLSIISIQVYTCISSSNVHIVFECRMQQSILNVLDFLISQKNTIQ